MKNETIKKINTFGKAGYILCKIVKIGALIAAIICFVAGAITCFVPRDTAKIELTTSNTAVVQFDDKLDSEFINNAGGFLRIGDYTYQLVENEHDEVGIETTTFYTSDMKWIFFSSAFVVLGVCIAFYYGEKLCVHFKNCETPFSCATSQVLMKLAYSLIGLYLLNTVAQSSVDSIFLGKFSFTLELDLVAILLVLCVFMLVFIFKHGTILQAESDELL